MSNYLVTEWVPVPAERFMETLARLQMAAETKRRGRLEYQTISVSDDYAGRSRWVQEFRALGVDGDTHPHLIVLSVEPLNEIDSRRSQAFRFVGEDRLID